MLPLQGEEATLVILSLVHQQLPSLLEVLDAKASTLMWLSISLLFLSFVPHFPAG